MGRAEWLQETRVMRFEDAYPGWTHIRLTRGMPKHWAHLSG